MSVRTKYFKGREPDLTRFEVLCKAHGLNQSEIINDMIARFVRENQNQQTLMAFPSLRDFTPALFEKASLVAARNELARVLDLIEESPENRVTFQPDLIRALKMVEPIYLRTRDCQLVELLQKAEQILK